MVDLLSEFEQEVIYLALHSLTLFTWCFYTKGDNIPDIEYIKKFNYVYNLVIDEKKNEKKKEKA